MRVLILLALSLAAVVAVPKNPQRIVGGSLTTISQYPSMCALLYSSNLITYRQSCGCTILTYRVLLTAAHCMIGDPVNRWQARVGSTYANSGGAVHALRTIIIHPNYNSWTIDSDVAVLHTLYIINFNINVGFAPIAGSNYNLADNQVVYAAGWGATTVGGPSSEQLRHVQIWTVNQAICRKRYSEIGAVVTDNMLCSGWLDVGGRDQCQGDSGGPLYHLGVVVGICSWGLGCGEARFPGVNARVSRMATFIKSAANQN